MVARASSSLMVRRELVGSLVSVAGLAGRPVRGQDGARVGRLADVVVRAEGDHPRVAGFVVRIGDRRAWVHDEDVGGVEQGELRLTSSRFDLQDVQRRPGEIQLIADVIDHQLVDVHGVRVVRASDLYLAPLGAEWHLVGVDVSFRSVLRRALPGRPSRIPSPAQVLDWAGIHALAVAEGSLRLNRAHQSLRLLSPGDLATLLEDLGRTEMRDLLDTLDPADAADALEAMKEGDLVAFLRGEPTERAAELLSLMERDEAVDALRDFGDGEREAILQAMDTEPLDELRALLTYDEDTAGGMMTPELIVVPASSTVGDAVTRLRTAIGHPDQTDYAVLVDDQGRLVDDVSALELLGFPADRPLMELVRPPRPATISPGEPLESGRGRDPGQAQLLPAGRR